MEMEPWDEEMDGLLRRSMAAEMPELSPNFERNLMISLDRTSKQLGKFRRTLVIGYLLASATTCVVIMHGEGLSWSAIGALCVAPLALVAAVPALLRLSQTETHRALR